MQHWEIKLNIVQVRKCMYNQRSTPILKPQTDRQTDLILRSKLSCITVLKLTLTKNTLTISVLWHCTVSFKSIRKVSAFSDTLFTDVAHNLFPSFLSNSDLSSSAVQRSRDIISKSSACYLTQTKSIPSTDPETLFYLDNFLRLSYRKSDSWLSWQTCTTCELYW